MNVEFVPDPSVPSAAFTLFVSSRAAAVRHSPTTRAPSSAPAHFPPSRAAAVVSAIGLVRVCSFPTPCRVPSPTSVSVLLTGSCPCTLPVVIPFVPVVLPFGPIVCVHHVMDASVLRPLPTRLISIFVSISFVLRFRVCGLTHDTKFRFPFVSVVKAEYQTP